MLKVISNLILIVILSACTSSQQPSGSLDDAPVKSYSGEPVGKFSRIEKDGRYGYKDERGNIIVSPIYNNLPEAPWERMIVKSGPLRGLINYRGDTLIEFGKYQELKLEHTLPLKRQMPNPHGVEYFSDEADWNIVSKKNDKWGMISNTEEVLLPIEFDSYKYIFDNKYAFSKAGEWIVVNAKGEKITEQTFDMVYQIFKYSYFVYKKGNEQGAYNIITNKDAIGLHEEVIAIEKEIIGAKSNGKYMLYNINGTKLSNQPLDTLFVNLGNNAPVDKSHLSDFKQNALAWAAIGSKHYLISKDGKMIALTK